ncbi:MAG: nucleotidyl transferase AbiEii/AbiGii toxin family protein [Methanosarcinales archaeon]
MITKEEIRRIARQKGIPAGIIEKDYVLGWLLYGISRSNLKNILIFKGGTALSKIYFPKLWRLSEDLDFTSTTKIDKKELKLELENIFKIIYENSGIEFNLDTIHAIEEHIIINIQFIGPLGGKNRTRLNIRLREKIILPTEERTVINIYSDDPKIKIIVYSLNEIFSEKLRSILEREKTRDYYDVWRLLKNCDFDLEEIKKLVRLKLRNKEFTIESIFNEEKLSSIKNYWERGLRHLTKDLPDFDTVIADLKQTLI